MAKLGSEDEPHPAAIERLVRSLAKYADVEAGAGNPLAETKPPNGLGLASGHVHALENVWSERRLGEVLHELARGRRYRFDVASLIKANTDQRIVVSGSERTLGPALLPGVYANEFKRIDLQHLERDLADPSEVGVKRRPASRG